MSTPVQAAENMLTGERTFKTISYAITGDNMADLMAVINTVVNESMLHCLAKAYVLEAVMKIQIAQDQWNNSRPPAPAYPTQQFGGIGQNALLNQCQYHQPALGTP